MYKKTILTLVAAATLSSGAFAAVPLQPFVGDFKTLMNGIARDVAPTLRMGALAGDLQGDATIDHFSVTALGLGLTFSDGLGTVLRPGATDWGFTLGLSDLVNNSSPTTGFEQFAVYPSLKFGFGLALPGLWDVSVTGFGWPQALADLAVTMGDGATGGLLSSASPQFSFANFGIQVRKTVIEDSGFAGFTPAVSLGGGYHFTSFNLGVSMASLEDLGLGAQQVVPGQTIDLSGSFAISTWSNVFTVDLQTSKHLLIFTPYLKLTGAYQLSNFTGDADMVAILDDGTTTTKEKLIAKPVVNLSDFTFLTTTGLEINLFLVVFNINVIADLGQAFLNVKSFDLDGINANAFSLNTGFRFSF